MNTKRSRLPINSIGNKKTTNKKNYTFLVFNTIDNSSYCINTNCSTYKEATEDYLSSMKRYDDKKGVVSHDNVIIWEDGTFTILSILNGHIQDDFTSWVKHVSEEKEIFYVQETVGGWRQRPIMSGSLQECIDYMDEENTGNKSLSIVPEMELEIDYL